MKSTKIRAYSLIQVITLLPLIAAITTMGTHLYIRTMRIQRLEIEYVTENNTIRHLVKRLREDALLADGVELHDDDGGQTLRLCLPGEEIIFETRGDQVTRTARIDGEQVSSYPRTLKQARVEFELENIRGTPRIIWIRIAWQYGKAGDAVPDWFYAAAALVGRGG